MGVGGRAGRVRVQVRVPPVIVRQMHVEPARGVGGPDAQGHERQAHQQLGPVQGTGRHPYAQQGKRTPHQQHHQGMTQRPAHPKPYRRAQPRAAAHEDGHGDHVIHLEGVTGAQRERRHVRRPQFVHAPLNRVKGAL
jgi:hypothetical protein